MRMPEYDRTSYVGVLYRKIDPVPLTACWDKFPIAIKVDGENEQVFDIYEFDDDGDVVYGSFNTKKECPAIVSPEKCTVVGVVVEGAPNGMAGGLSNEWALHTLTYGRPGETRVCGLIDGVQSVAWINCDFICYVDMDGYSITYPNSIDSYEEFIRRSGKTGWTMFQKDDLDKPKHSPLDAMNPLLYTRRTVSISLEGVGCEEAVVSALSKMVDESEQVASIRISATVISRRL